MHVHPQGILHSHTQGILHTQTHTHLHVHGLRLPQETLSILDFSQ
jgi:hypothetical protein